jgi:hypothetical protein
MTAVMIGGVLLSFLAAAPKEGEEEKVSYVRLLPNKPAPECVFTLERHGEGRTIRALTERGSTRMTVKARYDGKDSLLDARAELREEDGTIVAQVEVTEGKAKVKRDGKEVQEFEVPKGVIVTSAPDWTDTFLLCRHYDRRQGGKQEFAGLWIHPEQPAQRLTFTAEKEGTDTIEHNGKKMELTRLLLRIRNGSEYTAWTDGDRRMIKLTALPLKEKGGTELVLEGYEKSAAGLRPPQR